MKDKKNNDYSEKPFSIIRMVCGKRISEVNYPDGTHITGVHLYEANKSEPKPKTIISIAESLGINPDILFFCVGLIPESEKEIIKTDPFFFMKAIKKICSDHKKKYGTIDHKDSWELNLKNALQYCKKKKK